MRLKKEEGITLIALIITVILMLILASVAIKSLTVDGLFSKTSEGAEIYKKSIKNETDIIGSLIDELNKINGETGDDTGSGDLGGSDGDDTETGQDETPGVLAGTGNENDPYRIESIEDLVAFSNATNGIGTSENRVVTDRTSAVQNVNKYEGKHVELARNLDFESDDSYIDPKRKDFGDVNGDGTIDELKKELTTQTGTGFLPVGFQTDGFSSAVKAFQGTFEGNNKEIANVYVNQPNKSVNKSGYYCTGGIFGYVNSATIRNLTVSGAVVISSDVNDSYKFDDIIGIGGIIGLAESSTIENLNTKVQMQHNIEKEIYTGQFGGVVGILANSIIKDSQNNSSKLGKYFGGIVGIAKNSFLSDVTENNTKIINCVNNANFSDFSDVFSIAGIVYNLTAGTMENCTNSGDFSEISDLASIAGIAYTSTGIIENCINNGDFLNVVGTAECGGIISVLGKNSIVKNCINNGEINVQGFENIGGIVSTITSINTQVVSCKNNSAINSNNVYSTGGIVGSIEAGGNTISNCDNEGEITGGKNVGGILGNCSFFDGTTVDNCKNQKTIEGAGYVAGIVACANTNVTITNSSNNGDVSANLGEDSTMNVRAGGILSTGDCEKIENCCNTGNIFAYEVAAGIVAYPTIDNAIINNCYNTGNISTEGSSPLVQASGIVGDFRGPGEIYNCYNLGTINSNKAYGFLGTSRNYKIYNCYNLGELVGNNTCLHTAYDNLDDNQNYVDNVFTKGMYSIGKANERMFLNNVYNEKEFYSADGTYNSSAIDLKTTVFVNILNDFVDNYNSNLEEGQISLKRWKIDSSVEESEGYPMFE